MPGYILKESAVYQREQYLYYIATVCTTPKLGNQSMCSSVKMWGVCTMGNSSSRTRNKIILLMKLDRTERYHVK